MKRNRKGFTIVELVIVIAVIAILAAVLIPTFSGLIKKANLSADQQAVRQMNITLAAEGAVEKNDIFDVYDALSEMGMDAKDYKPLTDDTYFFWDAELDRVLHVDEDMKVLYPTEYADLNYVGRTWLSLSQTIATDPGDYASGDTSVTVETGAQLSYVLEDIHKGTSSKELSITIPAAGVDMMGATFSLPQMTAGAGYDIEITGGPIKNATAVDTVYLGDGSDSGHDAQYGCALIPYVWSGNTVTISGVTFENLNIKNTHGSGVALLVGGVDGTAKVTIDDVKIVNSTVIGYRNVGALVGYTATKDDGFVTLGDIELENVKVMTVGGRSGMLVGMSNKGGANTLTVNGPIKLTNCSYELYQCEQNTGTKTIGEETKTLGYNTSNNNVVVSWCTKANGAEEFNDTAYVKNDLSVNEVIKSKFVDKVTGW